MAHPQLHDLPFKIELNRWGRIEMSPASNERGKVQIDVAAELLQRPGEQAAAARHLQRDASAPAEVPARGTGSRAGDRCRGAGRA